MGQALLCIQADRSIPGGDQTSILSQEEKLVSLDVLKLYRGEDIVRQEAAAVDPDGWTDEGELTELPDIPTVDGD